MRYILYLLFFLPAASFAAETAFPKFKSQEIATDLTVGYAVIVADINEDKKPDIVVVDSRRVLWYENPTWKPHVVVSSKSKTDNVCIAAHDLDGDSHIDLVLGADWNPSNTKSGGTLQWLKRGKTLDEEWSVYPIGEEPTVHRVRMATIDGKPHVVMAPLMGRDSTKEKNWMDGRPVRILAYPIPKDPVKGPWVPKVLSEDLHVVHNFCTVRDLKGNDEFCFASYEGVSEIDDKGKTVRFGAGDQSDPKGSRGASEIKAGTWEKGKHFIATIEPWHGNQVVLYTPTDAIGGLWDRQVIDDQLRWGHAVWCADLDGDGGDELIIGVRDNPAKGDKFTEKCGVRIYKRPAKRGGERERLLLDEGGVAVEDLTAADLNGDGKIDIIAVGRATKNAKIYWNQGK